MDCGGPCPARHLPWLSSLLPLTSPLPHQCFLASPPKKHHSHPNPCLGVQLWGSQPKEEKGAPFTECPLTMPSLQRAPPPHSSSLPPHWKSSPVSSQGRVPMGQCWESSRAGVQELRSREVSSLPVVRGPPPSMGSVVPCALRGQG